MHRQSSVARALSTGFQVIGREGEAMKTFLRNLGAVVLGYVALAIVSFVLPMIMWMVLGADGSFQPDSWETSTVWNAGWIIVAVAGAVAAGFVCSKVAADKRGVWILIGVMVVSATLTALYYVPAGEGVRPADVAMFEAMGSARSPAWMGWLNMPLAAVSAFFGARIAEKD